MPPSGGFAVWRTCLREVAFVRDPSAADGSAITGEAAYALLLEIVCGLRSPLAGETEVQAQFKSFLSSLDPSRDGDLLRIGQRVLSDAKAIRARHLQGVCVHAYGPLAARFVPQGRRVVVLGTGALAAELGLVLGRDHEIDYWGRTPDTRRSGHTTLSSAGDGRVRSLDPTTLVVAAPVSSEQVRAVARCYPALRELIDLRGGADRQPLAMECRVIDLDDLFRAARREQAADDRIAGARREIAALSQAFGRREELRPFGWDDLPAGAW
jgi:glutamyl-tRNA reductase